MMEKLNLEPHLVKIDGVGWGFEEIGRAGRALSETGPAADRHGSVQ